MLLSSISNFISKAYSSVSLALREAYSATISFFGSLCNDSLTFDEQVEKKLNEWKVTTLSSPYLDSIPENRIIQQRKIIAEQLRNDKN